MILRHDVDWLLNYPYATSTGWRTFLYIYQGEYHRLGLTVLWYIIKHSGVWLMPLMTANIIDVVVDHKPLNQLWIYAALLTIIFLVNIPTHYLFIRNLSRATRNVETRLRAAIARRLQQLSIQAYRQQSSGRLQSKMLRDVEVIQQTTQLIFQVLPAAGITLVFALVVTAVRTPTFLLFFLLTIPTTAILIRSLRGALQERNRDFRMEMESLSSKLIEMIHLIPITRAHGLEEEELSKVHQNLDAVRARGVRLDSINAIFGATSWVVFRLFELLCLVMAAYLVYQGYGGLTVGDIVLLTGFFTHLTNAIMQLTNILPDITRGLESMRSLGEILEAPDLEQNQGKTHLKEVAGHFRFEDVHFSYPDSTSNSLKNISLDVPAGKTIALIGASGAGKSTFLNLVIGFLRPSAGCIWLDGHPMNDLDLRIYRRFVAFVPQETILFEGTIRENVTYGMATYDETALEQAIQAAHVDEFLDKLPHGVDTFIGENGAQLSGGQRQRIALARAFIRNPRVLILDEATSALDQASEALIQESLKELVKDRTTFVVAHRLSTIQNADHILVLEDGQIVRQGTYTSLGL